MPCLGLALSLLALASARESLAACNVIPPATPSFRSTLASTDRPFARPGDWMKLDLTYIDNWSLLLDLKILLKTVPVVLLGRGAK